MAEQSRSEWTRRWLGRNGLRRHGDVRSPLYVWALTRVEHVGKWESLFYTLKGMWSNVIWWLFGEMSSRSSQQALNLLIPLWFLTSTSLTKPIVFGALQNWKGESQYTQVPQTSLQETQAQRTSKAQTNWIGGAPSNRRRTRPQATPPGTVNVSSNLLKSSQIAIYIHGDLSPSSSSGTEPTSVSSFVFAHSSRTCHLSQLNSQADLMSAEAPTLRDHRRVHQLPDWSAWLIDESLSSAEDSVGTSNCKHVIRVSTGMDMPYISISTTRAFICCALSSGASIKVTSVIKHLSGTLDSELLSNRHSPLSIVTPILVRFFALHENSSKISRSVKINHSVSRTILPQRLGVTHTRRTEVTLTKRRGRHWWARRWDLRKLVVYLQLHHHSRFVWDEISVLNSLIVSYNG